MYINNKLRRIPGEQPRLVSDASSLSGHNLSQHVCIRPRIEINSAWKSNSSE